MQDHALLAAEQCRQLATRFMQLSQTFENQSDNAGEVYWHRGVNGSSRHSNQLLDIDWETEARLDENNERISSALRKLGRAFKEQNKLALRLKLQAPDMKAEQFIGMAKSLHEEPSKGDRKNALPSAEDRFTARTATQNPDMKNHAKTKPPAEAQGTPRMSTRKLMEEARRAQQEHYAAKMAAAERKPAVEVASYAQATLQPSSLTVSKTAKAFKQRAHVPKTAEDDYNRDVLDEPGTRMLRNVHGYPILPSKDFRRPGATERRRRDGGN